MNTIQRLRDALQDVIVTVERAEELAEQVEADTAARLAAADKLTRQYGAEAMRLQRELTTQRAAAQEYRREADSLRAALHGTLVEEQPYKRPHAFEQDPHEAAGVCVCSMTRTAWAHSATLVEEQPAKPAGHWALPTEADELESLTA